MRAGDDLRKVLPMRLYVYELDVAPAWLVCFMQAADSDLLLGFSAPIDYLRIAATE